MTATQLNMWSAPTNPLSEVGDGLRDYQREAVAATLRELEKVRSTLVVAHTGAFSPTERQRKCLPITNVERGCFVPGGPMGEAFSSVSAEESWIRRHTYRCGNVTI